MSSKYGMFMGIAALLAITCLITLASPAPIQADRILDEGTDRSAGRSGEG